MKRIRSIVFTDTPSEDNFVDLCYYDFQSVNRKQSVLKCATHHTASFPIPEGGS